MSNTKEQQLQAFARNAARVSRALWPTNVRRAIATDRMAQTRRRLIVTARYWRMNIVRVVILALAVAGMGMLVLARLWLLLVFLSMVIAATILLLAILRGRVVSMSRLQQSEESRSFPGVLSKGHSPNTPMPLEPPLVRVLETFDLSQTDVEHFLDLPEGGNTGGYSLTGLKEAQNSLPRKVHE